MIDDWESLVVMGLVAALGFWLGDRFGWGIFDAILGVVA